MLVRFALDTDTLTLGLNQINWETRSLHQRIIEKWIRYGILIFPGETFETSCIVVAIRQMPGEFRKLYQTAMKHGRLRVLSGPPHWKGFGTSEKEEDFSALRGNVTVACLDSVRAEFIGLDQSEVSREILGGAMEIVRTSTIDQARRFREAEEQSSRAIEEGTRSDDVWTDKFRDLATFAKQIVIVDRYAGENLAIYNANGLLRFLKDVDSAATRSTVSLITAQKERDPETIMSAIRNFRSSRNGVQKLKVFICPDRYFICTLGKDFIAAGD